VGQQTNKSRRKHDACGGIFVFGDEKKAITAMRQWPWFYR
jgi:hypothetical protein